jgi:hypothetical protein
MLCNAGPTRGKGPQACMLVRAKEKSPKTYSFSQGSKKTVSRGFIGFLGIVPKNLIASKSPKNPEENCQ